MGEGMGWQLVSMGDKARRVDHMSGDAGVLPKCEEGTQMTGCTPWCSTDATMWYTTSVYCNGYI